VLHVASSFAAITAEAAQEVKPAGLPTRPEGAENQAAEKKRFEICPAVR
jgi:hypothetical protein